MKTLTKKERKQRDAERRRALGEHHRAVIDALDPDPAESMRKRVETWHSCYPKGSLNYDGECNK